MNRDETRDRRDTPDLQPPHFASANGPHKPKNGSGLPARRTFAARTVAGGRVVGVSGADARMDIPRVLSDDHGVAECAALVGASRSTLERRFRRGIGRTVREVMETARVEHTKTLLRETDLKLSGAAAAGFGDSRMLSVVFRRATGETPSGFRDRERRQRPPPS